NIVIANNEEIQVKIIDYDIKDFEEDIVLLSLEIEIEFSIEISYYDWENQIPEIPEDIPYFEHIFSNQLVRGNAVVDFWVSGDFSETEFGSLELEIAQPIEVNDQNIKITDDLA
ncbi:MAG: hypothetical protein AB4372_12520, partial [Xenococcus sp. (in: cyanobacteria)]